VVSTGPHVLSGSWRASPALALLSSAALEHLAKALNPCASEQTSAVSPLFLLMADLLKAPFAEEQYFCTSLWWSQGGYVPDYPSPGDVKVTQSLAQRSAADGLSSARFIANTLARAAIV